MFAASPTFGGICADPAHHATPQHSLTATVSLALYAAYVYLAALVRPSFSYLRDVPGPDRDSVLWGSLPKILEAEPGRPGVEWMEEFGEVVRYTGFFG